MTATPDAAAATATPPRRTRRVGRIATALPVTRFSLREAVSRRLVALGIVVSLAFLALFGVGFAALWSRVIAEEAAVDPQAGPAAATVLTVLALWVVRVLASLLTILLASSAVASEVDSGLLHAVLARPISRTSWLAQRWLAFAVIVVGYVVAMGAAVLVIAGSIADFAPLDPARALAIVTLEMLVLLALGMLASTAWSSVTAGVLTFGLFGMAWLAGVIEVVGMQLDNAAMRQIGIVVSLVIPSDALWRGASFYLQPPLVSALLDGAGGNPFVGTVPPTTPLIVWSIGYAVVGVLLAGWRLRSRDL